MAFNRIFAPVWSARRWLLAVALSGAAAAYFGPDLVLGSKVPAEAALRRDVVQTVVAIGHVESRYRLDVGAQITGVVADVPVEEGQTVRQGDILIQLDDSDLCAAADQARNAVAAGEAHMRQLREVALPNAEENLAQAEATLITAETTYGRTEKLHAAGFATTAQLDTDRRDRDVARTRMRAARLEVASNQPGGSAYILAERLLDQARANLRSAETRLGYAQIAAPRAGILIYRNVERGDVVQPGRVLMTLSPATEVQLVVQIDEKNLGLLALGNPAIASADAYPDKTFPATLVYINPGVDLQRASVEVKLSVPPETLPDYLRQDMTVSVDIEVARKADAVVVPLRSVRDNDGATWVLTVRDGRARKQPVKIGLRGTTYVEIAQGLEPGQLVIPPSAAATAGQRVRVAGP